MGEDRLPGLGPDVGKDPGRRLTDIRILVPQRFDERRNGWLADGYLVPCGESVESLDPEDTDQGRSCLRCLEANLL